MFQSPESSPGPVTKPQGDETTEQVVSLADVFLLGGGGGGVAGQPQNGCEGDYRKSRQDNITSRQEDIENRRRVIFDPDTAPLALAVNKSPAALDDL